MNQQHIEAPSIILSTDTNAFHSEQNQQQMKFETEPIREFRGRELSDYIPKSETKRDGTKSEQRKCSYFADMKNRHYFNLLVCYFDKEIFNSIYVLDSDNAFIR